MQRLLLTSLLILSFCTCGRAQTPSDAITQSVKSQDLRKDSLFFEQQAQVYQQWLDNAGIGQYLHYRELHVQAHRVDIYLEFKSDNIDTQIAQWDTLKVLFSEGDGVTLEEQLFYKAHGLMEVTQDAISVQFHDTYDPYEVSNFGRMFYFKDGYVQTVTNNPRSAIEPIEIYPGEVEGETDAARTFFNSNMTKEMVYDQILSYAHSRYDTAGFNGVMPSFDVLEKTRNLRFEVSNLRLEVLKNSNTLCQWLLKKEINCPWAKRERLIFRFTYLKTEKGIIITGDIDGQVGSGLYGFVERGGYLPMETDYKAEIGRYTEKYTVALTDYLKALANRP